jgi:predicted metal-dependent hydrolase
MITVETSGGPVLVPYEIRRSLRGRRIRLSLGPQNQALLRVPPRGSLSEAINFLRTQGDWLQKQLRKAPPPMALAEYLTKQPRLSGGGRVFAIALNFTSARPFFVHSEKTGEAEFRYPAGEGSDVDLRDLLRQFAENVLPPRVRELAGRYVCAIKGRGGVHVRVAVRFRSTGGSFCSRLSCMTT